MITREQLQWVKVARYVPSYMGWAQKAHAPFFDFDNNHQNGDGYDCEGNSNGYYETWDSFIEFKREFPLAHFHIITQDIIVIYDGQD